MGYWTYNDAEVADWDGTLKAKRIIGETASTSLWRSGGGFIYPRQSQQIISGAGFITPGTTSSALLHIASNAFILSGAYIGNRDLAVPKYMNVDNGDLRFSGASYFVNNDEYAFKSASSPLAGLKFITLTTPVRVGILNVNGDENCFFGAGTVEGSKYNAFAGKTGFKMNTNPKESVEISGGLLLVTSGAGYTPPVRAGVTLFVSYALAVNAPQLWVRTSGAPILLIG